MGCAAFALVSLVGGTILRVSPVNASAGCGLATTLPPGESRPQELRLGEWTRHFRITLPAQYDPARPYPVVLGFHGWGNSGEELQAYDGIVAAAQRGEVIGLHPDGATDAPPGRTPWRAWNAVGSSAASGATDQTCVAETKPGDYACYTSCTQGCSKCSWASCADDVGFVEALLDHVEASLCVDRSRIRAHGESNGGMMVWQLLQSPAAQRFQTLVSVIGAPGRGTQRAPAAPVRFLGLWGASDTTIPEGRNGTATSWDGFYYEPAADATARVAAAFSCGEPRTWDSGVAGLNCTEYPACASGAEVVRCTFQGDHNWPTQATPMVLRFDEGLPEQPSAALIRHVIA